MILVVVVVLVGLVETIVETISKVELQTNTCHIQRNIRN
jgi:hypothetical protein